MKPGSRVAVVAFRKRSLLLSVVLLMATAGSAVSQSTNLWSGNVVCTLNDQDANYFRQETQTWALTGGAPTPQGAMQIYPATWTATGQGQRQIVQGAQTTNVAWSLNGSISAPAQIDIFVRASDNRLIIKPWHTQLTVPNAVHGTRQVWMNGAVQSSNDFSHSANEWQFPRIEARPTDASVSGSTQSQADAGGAEIVHHYGGVPPSTVCEWKFTKGGAASASGQGSPSSSGPTVGPGTQNPGGMTSGTTGSGRTQNPTTGSTGNTGSQNTGGATSGTAGSTGMGSAPPQNPAAPSNVIATTGNGSVSLRWSAPTGSSIAGYTVLVLPTGSSINTSATSLTIPGLTNGTTYMFQVVAVSAQGTQSPPATSNAVTPMGATAPPTNLSASTPAPTNVTATAGDALATVSWSAPAAGFIASYTVQSLPSGPTVNTSATSITVPGLANGSTYMFQVTATSAQGVQSAPAFSNAVTPVAATLTPTGTSTAPSAAPSGATLKIPSTVTPIHAATPTVITATPAATPTVPVLKPAPGVVANPVKPTPTSTTSTPAPASGNYLITISALQCLVPTRDDPLNRDGTGDEIYASVFVRQYDRKTGQPLNSAYPQTRIYGDLTGFPDHNFPDRIQAGTHSASGGIQSPNFIPDGANPFAKRTLPPQADQFPLQIWQGTLADNGDVLILSPSVWESDGDMTVFNQWIQSQVSLTSSLFLTSKVQNQITSQTFGTMVLGVSESVAGGIPQTIGASAAISIVSATFGLPPFEILFYGTGKDRPIGLNDGSSATSTQAMLPNTTLVLTREIIENQVLRNGQTFFTMPIQFTDKANFGMMDSDGSYMMFLQIERQ